MCAGEGGREKYCGSHLPLLKKFSQWQMKQPVLPESLIFSQNKNKIRSAYQIWHLHLFVTLCKPVSPCFATFDIKEDFLLAS